jgi:hypothetical protein
MFFWNIMEHKSIIAVLYTVLIGISIYMKKLQLWLDGNRREKGDCQKEAQPNKYTAR